jgi:putative ABC transport system permease protein
VRELRIAFRRLRLQPGFALAAISTLALGMAAPTALYAVVQATLLRPLPYPRAGDIYAVRTTMSDGRFTMGGVASEELSALRRTTDGVIGSALVRRRDGTILTDAGPRQVTSFGVSEGFFELFGLPMAVGQRFTPDDFAAPYGSRVVLSYHAWRAMFGADPHIIGTTIRMANSRAVVVGVAPAAFEIPREADLWVAERTFMSIGHNFDAYVRLQPGLTAAVIQSRLPPMWADLAKRFPDMEVNRVFTMRPLLDTVVGDLGPILLIAFAATGLLLLLAMVNVANLLLARGTTRGREVAVRAALGATRRDLLRPLLAESSLIALAATAVGLPLAYVAVRAIVRLGGSALPRVEGMRLDAGVFLFSAIVMVIAVLVVGLAPATTMATPNLSELANEGGRGGLQGRTTRRVLAAMVVVEVTFAMALVAGANRLLLSMQHLLAIDPGFTSDGRLAVDVVLPYAIYGEEPARLDAWTQLADERLRALGVTSMGIASTLPLRHEWDATSFVDITNHPTGPENRPNGRVRVVSPNFFDVCRIRIAAGRSFTRDDRRGSPPVVLVNRAWLRAFLPETDPLRARIDPQWFDTRVDKQVIHHDAAIVGVVEDVPYVDLTRAAEPTVYISDAQVVQLRRSLVVTSADGHPERLAPQIRAALATLDPQVPVDTELLSDAVSRTLIWPKLGLLLMATFGIAALVLAATGVFGVITFVTAQRSGEMAVRLALGAPRGHVFRLVMQHGGLLTVWGLIGGLLLAWWTGQLMGNYVYHVSATNALVLGGSAMLILLVSLAAILPSARRAATIRPGELLKS